MTPTHKLLALAGVGLLVAGAVVWFPEATLGYELLAGMAGLVAAADALWLRGLRPLEVRRRLPGRFAVGAPAEVVLWLRNPGRLSARIEVIDGLAPQAVALGLPWGGTVERESQISYQLRMRVRGVAVVGSVYVRRDSPLGLWARVTRHLPPESVKVYPNYEPVIRFALLATLHRPSPLGIVRRAHAGASRDFHQLRDFREGDPLAQIDWKATSRRQQIISRDFQEQRNQSLVFLVDTGRRMRAIDGELPQFDHLLNSILLVAHLALRQGDQVAVQSFGGSDRWLPPIKGSHAMPMLLNHLYDYQTTPATSDVAAAVERLMTRQTRRSLVLLLTNLRGEDGHELLPAMQVLNSRHLVLLASLREATVHDALVTPIRSFAAAAGFLAAHQHVYERREVLATLGAAGVLTLDTSACDLPVALANSYLEIKATGRL